MCTRRLLALVLAFLWLWPASLHAQSDAIMRAFDRGGALMKQGRYEEAMPFIRKAMELSETELGPDNAVTAGMVYGLAAVYYKQGNYAKAEPLIMRALAIFEKALGPDDPNVAKVLGGYAALLRKTGRSAEAAELEARAKAIQAKHE